MMLSEAEKILNCYMILIRMVNKSARKNVALYGCFRTGLELLYSLMHKNNHCFLCNLYAKISG